jgi:hypothetical protein
MSGTRINPGFVSLADARVRWKVPGCLRQRICLEHPRAQSMNSESAGALAAESSTWLSQVAGLCWSSLVIRTARRSFAG